VYLQETHLGDKEHEKLRRMGFLDCFFFFSSYKSGHRSVCIDKEEVAILISNRLNFEKVSEMGDKEGRYILVKGKIYENLVTLLNI